MRHSYTQQLEDAVKQSSSIRQVLQLLGLVEAGGNYITIKRQIDVYLLDTTHFHGKGWRRNTSVPVVAAQPISKLLQNETHVQSFKLKNKLFAEGLKVRACEKCHLNEWLGQPIPLELDHINGNRLDNRLENLRVLYPNCHAMTATYRGKNKKHSHTRNSLNESEN